MSCHSHTTKEKDFLFNWRPYPPPVTIDAQIYIIRLLTKLWDAR